MFFNVRTEDRWSRWYRLMLSFWLIALAAPAALGKVEENAAEPDRGASALLLGELRALREEVERLRSEIEQLRRQVNAPKPQETSSPSGDRSAARTAPSAPSSGQKASDASKSEVQSASFDLVLSGAWSTDIYSQNHFTLGKSPYKDQYAWQGLLLRPEIHFGRNVKLVARTYLGKGIWGLDNEPADRTGGFSRLFNNKDTKFLFHTLWTYMDVTLPDSATNFKVGRQKFGLGNLLVLDANLDGVVADQALGKNRGQLTLGWAKVSEGTDSLSDAVTPTVDSRDATLYLAGYQLKRKTFTLNPYYTFYNDAARQAGSAYLPEKLPYFRSRFRPQVSTLSVAGVAVQSQAGGFNLKAELDVLRGRDAIPNPDSGPNQLLDINDGSLTGYNVLVDTRYTRGPSTLGFLFGRGSGDRDVASGKGNINALITQGFWYATEVWEDSVMPDEEGITPQGLGGPNIRGYRELENTTLYQASLSRSLTKKLRLTLAYNLLRATHPVQAWSDRNGDGRISPAEFLGLGSSDLGQEFWGRVDYVLLPGLTTTLRGGVFRPGDGAGFLINGTSQFQRPSWELRGTLQYLFDNLSLGKVVR